MFEEFDFDSDSSMDIDSIEYLRMFFIFDSVLEASGMDSHDAVELFELIQQQSLQ